MQPIFVGIAGGTGAGKSTLCVNLRAHLGSKVGVLQLDNYCKPLLWVPKLHGMANWDHPSALDFDQLEMDLRRLSEGQSVTIKVRPINAAGLYSGMQNILRVDFQPKPIVLVDGHLILFERRIRRFLSTSIWLDAPHDIRWRRRVHFKFRAYEKLVLRPMHRQYVEPTKLYARHVISVDSLTPSQIFGMTRRIIFRRSRSAGD